MSDPPERIEIMSDLPSGIRFRRSPDPLCNISGGLVAVTAIFVAVSTGALLAVAMTTVMSWVMGRTGEGGAVSARPILAGVALPVLIGMLWGIYRVVRQVYRLTAVALFRVLSLVR